MWNKIEDVRPGEGDVVIAYSVRDGISYETYFCFDSYGAPIWQRSGRCNMENVTHWRYKLTPPTTEQEESPATDTQQANYEICPTCCGSGRVYMWAEYGDGIKCHRCNGSGKLS